MSSWLAPLYLNSDPEAVSWPLRSVTHIVHAFLSVDRNGKIQAVSVTVSVPILSGSDLDTFTLVKGKVSKFRDHFPIFLA